jgi:uncharacterized phage protein (TIGR02218 family)
VTLLEHLATGAATTCRCWALDRTDGLRLGFTDHDRDLSFEGTLFRAAAGMTARAVAQTTGLAVDNSEALSILSDEAVTEVDLKAGRYDGAEVRCWLVNWAETEERLLLFRGTIGEVTLGGGAFRAELRGMAERLNRPQGRVFQPMCAASLGDGACKVDLAPLSDEVGVLAIREGRMLTVSALGRPAGWYTQGSVLLRGGAAAGLSGRIKSDRSAGDVRLLELWQELPVLPAAGDLLRLVAGCDRMAETCRAKFGNFANFRGFPHIPGDDWLASYPVRAGGNDGGSLRRGE